ncbi:hypothetical protein K458DRAFT_405380 [Lentithecium fluviatile CBS 122367]|uniref:Cellular morphogenesis protein n=1 Tax=Lentithecium fluviatile CBS 122367 TaxID=1168545 RepID=A0A6G1IXC2_9PLEO|nr:hypothetical protein K458DRAFT_405380 [Lentithecium fluviatile CBS 122367]
MREPFSSMLASRAGKLALSLLLASPQLIPGTAAFTFVPIPSPNLNLDPLGRVAFAGDFDAISLYQFQDQSQEPAGVNGASAILSRFPNGVFATIQKTDGDVKAMCAYQKDGNLHGIVVGGNFTSVDGTHTPGGIAMIDPNTGDPTAVEGLNGSVNALHCDSGRGQVYVGGSFTGAESANAIIWKGNWSEMSFLGFNGPVNSIVAGLNDTVVFGGEFSGLGNNITGATENNTQALPVGSANLTAQTSSGRPGFTEPKNIACKGDQIDSQGANSTWLLADNTPGFWRADFGFGFKPTKLQLYNTNFESRGTKTWRYTALPDGGIMNFTFTDPTTGQKSFCDARCPLPQGNRSAQDFFFVNKVGMNAFRIDISDWYGQGGGLNAVQLFATDVFSYAIDEFNRPSCGGVQGAGSATKTGPWLVTPSHDSNAQYLTATLQTNNIDPSANFVVFQPNIPQSGNYSIKMYTPGCRGDGTCGTRGRVNISSSVSSKKTIPSSVELYQTNEFDKYDEIYNGYVDATDGFRPSVTLAPVANQNPGTGVLTVVAQRVGFEVLNASSGELNGLFEYDPDQQEVEEDFSKSVINSAGAGLTPADEAKITTLATADDNLFVGGSFSSDGGLNNIFAIAKDAQAPTQLSGGGLNSQVNIIYANGSDIWVGGNFTDLKNGGNSGLKGVAAYVNDNWQALGAGVTGVVMNIVPFSMNVTDGIPEEVLGISGFFTEVNGFSGNAAFSVNDFAVWVPSQKNWLQNLNTQGLDVQGHLTAWANIPNADRLYGGAVSSQSLGASGAAVLQHGGPSLSLSGFSLDIQAQQSSLRKRSLTEGQNLTTTGIVTAVFDKSNNRNLTIVGGHFATTGSDGQNITNVVIIDEKDSNKVTGFTEAVDSNSTFAALAVQDNTLFAGGRVTGQIDNNRVAGVVAWDLSTNNFASTQPPPLQGTNVTVNAIAPRRNSKDVFVAGRFESAGALSCPALCIWNTERNQWTAPGGDISGVVTSLFWISDTKLMISGNLTVNNNQTSLFTFDSTNSQFQTIAGASELPGSVTAFTPASASGNQIWAAGEAADGSAFLQRFDGSKWLPVNDMLQPDTNIRGLQVLSLNENHDEAQLIDQNQDLLLLGQINITGFGSASAALFNGTAMIPFLLSTTAQNTPGSLSQIFVENPQSFFQNGNKHLALGFVVLIALAIALALTFLLVVAGILVEYYRKKAAGYSPAPTSYTDRMGNVGRVPPEELFGTLSGPRAPAI